MLAGFKSPHSFPHVRPHTIILVWSGTCGKVISRGDPIQVEFAYSSLLNLVLTRPVALVASKSTDLQMQNTFYSRQGHWGRRQFLRLTAFYSSLPSRFCTLECRTCSETRWKERKKNVSM